MENNEIKEITDRLDRLTDIISRISGQLDSISKKFDAQIGEVPVLDKGNSEYTETVPEPTVAFQNTGCNTQYTSTQTVDIQPSNTQYVSESRINIPTSETVSTPQSTAQPAPQVSTVNVGGDKKYSGKPSEKSFELGALTDTIEEDSIYEISITDSAHGVFRLMEERLDCLKKKSPAVIKRVCMDEGNHKSCSRIVVESLGKIEFDAEDKKWKVTERCKVKFV